MNGVQRRFEVIGTNNGVTVVDDYGHHPTEIAATLRVLLSLSLQTVACWFVFNPIVTVSPEIAWKILAQL